jgi:PAS domain S-box-containing protein
MMTSFPLRESDATAEVGAVPAVEVDCPAVLTDADAVILCVNSAFERLTGLSAADVVGAGAGTLLDPPDDEGQCRAIRAGLARSGHWHGRVRVRRLAGGESFDSLTVTVLHDGAGRATHYLGLLTGAGGAQAAPVSSDRPAAPAAPSDGGYLEAELFDLMARDPDTLRFLQNAALDGMWYWDLEHPENEWMSASFWRLFGVDPAKRRHLSSEWQDLIDPDDLATALSNFERHAADPSHPYDQIVRYRHVDGSTVWVRCRGMAIRDAAGRPLRMLGAHSDVTALMRTQQELKAAVARLEEQARTLQAALADLEGETAARIAAERQSARLALNHSRVIEAADASLGREKARLDAILEGTQAGTWEWTVPTGEVAVNDRLADIMGETQDSLAPFTQDDWFARTHPEDVAMSADMLDRHLRGEIAQYDCELRIRHRDGHWVWVLDRGRVVERDGDGAPLRMAGTSIDITDHVRHRAALAEREQLYRLAQAATGVGIWDWDVARDVVSWDAACWRILGYDAPAFALTYRNCQALMHPDDRERIIAAVERQLAEGGDFCVDLRFRSSGGDYVWVQGRGQVVARGAAGAPLRMIGTHTPIQQAKEAQLQVEAFAERLGLLARHLPGFLYQYRLYPDGRSCFPYASDGIRTIYGCDPEDVAEDAAAVFAVLHPDDADRVGREVHASAERSEVWTSEYRVRHPDKGDIWVAGHASPERLPDGSVLWHGYIADVSERRRLERDARERGQLYRSIFESVSDVVFLIAVEGPGRFRYRASNAALIRQTGLDALEGRTPHEVLLPEVADTVCAEYRHCVDTKAPHAFETVFDLPKGRQVWETRLTPIPDETGAVTLVAAIGRNVTAARKAHDDAVAREHSLTVLFDAIPDPVLLIDPGTGVAWRFNAAAAAQLGYTMEDFGRLSVRDYEAMESAEETANHIARIVANGPEVFETRHRHRDGHLLDVRVSACPVDMDGQAGLLCVFTDVSGPKRLQEDLKRSNAELEQFAYVISHDLRAPLRMITSFAQLIERDMGERLSDTSRGFLTHVEQGGQRMDEMLLALLSYSRVGRQGDPMTLLPARELVDEALAYLDPAIRERGAVVTVSGSWPAVEVSRNEGVRLFQNLIGNALKYGPSDGPTEVTVSVDRDPEGWRFAVADNGIGIDPAQVPRLFKVFQRLHTREQYEGTGIGLAICRRIVERHGGRICIESDGPGRGTTVLFTLPDPLADRGGPP